MSSRRTFLMTLAVAGSGGAVVSSAIAQAKMVQESDPQAVALGYVHDTTKVDAKKYPKHDKTQHCGDCALYQGKPGAKEGPCPLFPGKDVALNGWCSSWTKKA